MLEDRTNPTPVITIMKGADAYEGVSNGSFILSRTDDPNFPISQSLTVNVSVSGAGTATPGQDYQYITSNVTFAAGSATATVTVNVMGQPYDDGNVEPDETVILNIAGPGQNYTVGDPSSATVKIVDNDTASNNYYWIGQGVDDLWSTPNNWTTDTVNHTPTSDSPHGMRDNVYFDASYSNLDSVGGGGYSGYKSLHMINSYSGVLSLSSESFNTFEQTTGTIDQPTASTNLIVTESFNWTGGTLNSTTNLATVTLTGSTMTGTIAPTSAGTVYCGSNLNVEDGAQVEFDPGTISFTNNPDVNIGENSTADVLPVTINSTVKYSGVDQINLGTNALFSVTGPGTFDGTGVPLYNLGGTVSVLGMATVQLGGKVTANNGVQVDASYCQDGTLPYLQIESGADLQVENKALITSGKLLTLYNSNLLDNVNAQTATITGDLTLAGGTVIICNPGLQWHYGTLYVTGKVDIYGGEYKPKIAGATSGKNDIWKSDGNFTLAANNNATLSPWDNAGANTVASGIWTIIKSNSGAFTGTFAVNNLIYFLGPPVQSFTWGTAGNPVNQANLIT
jgi:hypothetical protein